MCIFLASFRCRIVNSTAQNLTHKISHKIIVIFANSIWRMVEMLEKQAKRERIETEGLAAGRDAVGVDCKSSRKLARETLKTTAVVAEEEEEKKKKQLNFHYSVTQRLAPPTSLWLVEDAA